MTDGINRVNMDFEACIDIGNKKKWDRPKWNDSLYCGEVSTQNCCHPTHRTTKTIDK